MQQKTPLYRRIHKFHILVPALFLLTVLSLIAASAPTGSDHMSDMPKETAPVEGPASNTDLSTLPLNLPESGISSLEESADADLQAALDRILRSEPEWAALARKKKLSIGLVDLRNPTEPRYARVNDKEMVYAASLPKIAVLLTAMDAIDRGDLVETGEIRQDMRLMIAKSNNAATTRMIDRVGLDRIARVMQDPCYRLYDRKEDGGLWVGKAYGRGGVRKGDPIKNLSHAATAEQVCRYYYMLANGQLISPERSKEMLGYLGDPELHHKFVNTLDRIAPEAKVYRKSGSWKNWHADSVLVWGQKRKYILVGLSETPNGEALMRELIRRIDKALLATPVA